jgi:hypothetical protein
MKHAAVLLIIILLLAVGWFGYLWTAKRTGRRRND